MIGFILRHKVLVVITWVVLTTVGILTLPRIGTRLDYTYTTPGQTGFEANLKITGRFGIDPAFESMLPVLYPASAGLDMTSPEGRKLAADTFAAVKISSTTLAVGVIMDAVIIRTLLVPALVALMGRWNWWMPGGLARYLPARTSGH